MTSLHILLLTAFSLLLSTGQILFKITAKDLPDLNNLRTVFFYFLHSISFWAALILYGTATLLWIYLLKLIPLSQAYPFMALGFIFVPLASYVLFQEPIGIKYMLGTALILTGLAVVSTT